MRFRSLSSSCAFLLWASLLTPCRAQSNKLFQWQFANGALSQSLPTCFDLPIVVKSFNVTLNDTQGTPPYYMMSFAIGGTPKTELIGTSNDTLKWQVTHPPDTQLLLSVVDSNGSAGGVPPQIFKVIAGQSLQCVSTPTAQDFTVTSNVTGDLTTCQPWGLTVKGGAPPYNVTLAALNSPIITNVTMPFGLDVFTYIDRADPNGQLIAAISDVTGRWATGTPLVNTKGSTDVNCTGLVSSSGNSTDIKRQQQEAAAAARSSKKRTSILIGVCVTLGALILITAAGVFLLMRRRRMRVAHEITEDQDVLPRRYEDSPSRPGQVLSISNFISSPDRERKFASTTDVYTPSNLTTSPNSIIGSNVPYDPYSEHESSSQATNRDSGSSISGRPGFANFPPTPTKRSLKAVDVRGSHELNSREQGGNLMAGNMTQTGFNRSASVQTPIPEGTESEVIFQHRDGGLRIKELPPPYADRGLTSR